MPTTDTSVQELIINQLTLAEYQAAVNAGTINENELYMVTDVDYPSLSDLATVATSGNYNDLTNKPTIPSAQVQSDWNATTGMGVILNKPTLSNVATSGNYNDLTNKPTWTYNAQTETLTLG